MVDTLEMYYARGDLCIGSCTQGIGEVLWSRPQCVLFSD